MCVCVCDSRGTLLLYYFISKSLPPSEKACFVAVLFTHRGFHLSFLYRIPNYLFLYSLLKCTHEALCFLKK